jgi:hypothetical protein
MSTSGLRDLATVPLLALAIAACAASLDDRDRFLQALEQTDGGVCDVPSVFSSTCAIAGCHTSQASMGHLDLEAANPFARLVGKMASGGGVLIDSGGDPGKSVLYLKLKSPPPYGAQMPLNAPKLSDETVACIAGWITEQAKLLDAGSPAGGFDGGGGDDSATATGMDAAGDGGDDAGGDDAGSAVDTGTSGQPEGGADASGVTFTQVYASIIQGNCLPCHATGNGNNMGMLDMSSQSAAYTNLVGVMAAGSQCGNSGEMRVVAGSSATSLLVQILSANPPCGSQMPVNATPLASSDIATIAAWIDLGALNN